MLSDEERDIDVESDDDGSNRGGGSTDKRAHHNALERKRRDHIKDSFCKLRDAIPAMQGDKLSRAQILKKASDYIVFMRKKNSTHQHDVDDLKRQNTHLEAQIRALERAKSLGNFSSVADILNESGLMDEPPPIAQRPVEEFSYDPGSGSDTSESSSAPHTIAPGQSLLLTAAVGGAEPPKKKLKTDSRKSEENGESLIKKRSL